MFNRNKNPESNSDSRFNISKRLSAALTLAATIAINHHATANESGVRHIRDHWSVSATANPGEIVEGVDKVLGLNEDNDESNQPGFTEVKTVHRSFGEEWARYFAADRQAGQLVDPAELEQFAEKLHAYQQDGWEVAQVRAHGTESAEDDSVDENGVRTGGLQVTTPSAAEKQAELGEKRRDDGLIDLNDDMTKLGTPLDMSKVMKDTSIEDVLSDAEVAEIGKLVQQYGYDNPVTLIEQFNRAPDSVPPEAQEYLYKTLAQERTFDVNVTMARPAEAIANGDTAPDTRDITLRLTIIPVVWPRRRRKDSGGRVRTAGTYARAGSYVDNNGVARHAVDGTSMTWADGRAGSKAIGYPANFTPVAGALYEESLPTARAEGRVAALGFGGQLAGAREIIGRTSIAGTRRLSGAQRLAGSEMAELGRAGALRGVENGQGRAERATENGRANAEKTGVSLKKMPAEELVDTASENTVGRITLQEAIGAKLARDVTTVPGYPVTAISEVPYVEGSYTHDGNSTARRHKQPLPSNYTPEKGTRGRFKQRPVNRKGR